MSGPTQFRKKPVVISAIQWTGENLVDVIHFTDGRPPNKKSSHAGMMWDQYVDVVRKDGLKIFTMEGKMDASIGDWIIKGVKGEHYPCKPEIFALTYDDASASTGLSQAAVAAALQGFADDYMTSENHHPGYVLIPTAKFDAIRAALSTPAIEPQGYVEVAKDRADWLLDAVACATQNRQFLRGEPEYDEVAGEAILLNGEKAISVAISRALASRPAPQPAADTRVVKPLDTCFDEIRAVVKAAEDERARYGDIAATIRINALHHGATSAEAEAMVKGETSFLSWILEIVDKRSATPAPSDKIAEAARAAHGALWELNPDNYDHDDVLKLNDASVEAIFLLADAIGETHGKTPEWWEARRRALAGQGKTP